ncbi:hypothetical protein [Nonomuraea sp. NPDC049480]|uniref:hypothetical protein n=1 Tax=Nonomuraea sp. NPDC049480 TaxID=3364353 RepID=UPI0037B85A9F
MFSIAVSMRLSSTSTMSPAKISSRSGASPPGIRSMLTLAACSGVMSTLLGRPRGKVTISTAPGGLRGQIVVVEHLGAETVVAFTLGESRDLHYARMPGDVYLDPGADCRVDLELSAVSWFDPETGGASIR